jgi:hypothetical protein
MYVDMHVCVYVYVYVYVYQQAGVPQSHSQ